MYIYNTMCAVYITLITTKSFIKYYYYIALGKIFQIYVEKKNKRKKINSKVLYYISPKYFVKIIINGIQNKIYGYTVNEKSRIQF